MSCSDCLSGNWLPGSPKGTEENGAYLAEGSNIQEGTKDKAIVVLTDAFGLSISNSKIIADALAERTGFDVWVPDIFNGASYTAPGVGSLDTHPIFTTRTGRPPIAPEALDSFVPRHPNEKVGFWRKVGLYWTLLTHIFRFIASRSAVVDPRTKEVSPSALYPVD